MTPEQRPDRASEEPQRLAAATTDGQAAAYNRLPLPPPFTPPRVTVRHQAAARSTRMLSLHVPWTAVAAAAAPHVLGHGRETLRVEAFAVVHEARTQTQHEYCMGME